MFAKHAMIEFSPRYTDHVAAQADGMAEETVLPLYLAMPLILAMSLALWAGIWQLGAWLLALLA